MAKLLRYSDEELSMFGENIEKKILEAKENLALLREEGRNQNDTSDTFSPSKDFYEDARRLHSKDANQNSIERTETFIRDLSLAQIRIKNKTYGICRVTGKLIPKERLLIVPHATLCVEAKNAQKNGWKK